VLAEQTLRDGRVEEALAELQAEFARPPTTQSIGCSCSSSVCDRRLGAGPRSAEGAGRAERGLAPARASVRSRYFL